MLPDAYIVRLYEGVSNNVLMQSRHDYLPYAQKQAEVWRQLYPEHTVTINLENME